MGEICSREETIHFLAECIARAYVVSKGNTGYDSDIYWHTRERVMEVAREHSIRTPEVISHFTRAFRWVYVNTEFKDDNPFWPLTMHPDLLIEEVHSS